MELTRQVDGDRLSVFMAGRSTFGDYKHVEQLCHQLEQLSPRLKAAEVDLTALEYIDSAGLGMLLLIREQCEKHLIRLTLRCAEGQVWKMLEVSRLADLFGPIALAPATTSENRPNRD